MHRTAKVSAPFLASLVALSGASRAVEIVELADAPYVYYGTEAGARAGSAVAGAWRLFGTGPSPLLIGAYLGDPFGLDAAGKSYVFDGGAAPGSHALAGADAVVYGTAASGRLGFDVSGGGDVNADGFTDAAFGAWGVDADGHFEGGAAYVVFGGSTLPGLITADEADLVLLGEDPIGHFGWSVDIAADLNRDGIQDIVVGAPLGDAEATAAGEVFIFFGGPDLVPGTTLRAVDADVHLSGNQQAAGVGHSIATGDINGDGSGDLLIGSANEDILGRFNAGAVYLYLGRATWPSALVVQTDYNVVFAGAFTRDAFGSSVDVVGDMEGDGYPEIAVGSPFARVNSVDSVGRVHLFHGGPVGGPVFIDSRTQYAAVFEGIAEGDLLGYAVSRAGNAGGNGRADVAFGAPGFDPLGRAGAGAVFILFGRNDSFPTETDVTLASDEVHVGANPGDEAGAALALLRDFTGDGSTGLAVGAPGLDFTSTAAKSGGIYLVSGIPVVAVADLGAPVVLSRPYPSPSPGEVRLSLGLDRESVLDVFVTDSMGRLVQKVRSGWFPGGTSLVRWDGRSAGGSPVSPGVYFLTVRADGGDARAKVVIVR
jgi:hypothetical protein